MNVLYYHRYRILRRTLQLLVLVLFIGGNVYGWKILQGNYSSGLLFDTIPLSDPYAVIQILATGFVAGTDLLIGGVLVLLIYGLLFGRIFCTWICPMNILADSALYIHKKLKFESLIKISRKTRYGVFIFGLILSPIIAIPAFEAINPITILSRGIIFGIGSGWAIVAAIFLFDMAVVRYGWCGHLCPVGAFYALVSRFSAVKVLHNADNCTNCGKCFKVCHEAQVLDIINLESGIIKSPECTICLRCVEICDDNALELSLLKMLKRKNN